MTVTIIQILYQSSDFVKMNNVKSIIIKKDKNIKLLFPVNNKDNTKRMDQYY